MLKKLAVSSALILMMFSYGYADTSLKYYNEINPTRDFSLTDQDGNKFQLKDHRGKAVLLFFGYLSCPDICPVTMSRISRVYQKLNSTEKEKVLTVFISVDGDRDTPEKIKEYLDYFDMKAVGLTGNPLIVDEVVADFKAWYEKVATESSLGYLIDHTTYIYLIDTEGNVRALFHPEDNVDDMMRAVKQVLKESPKNITK
ncbi:MAG: SCO family protein [Candidatus Omnitrophica bacterium]|nr:SCO family protein [Candidatus Omnitrophota bacterium]